VRVARLAAEDVPQTVTSNETRGYFEAVVAADTDQILGVSILAAEGGEIMGVSKSRCGRSCPALRDMSFAHPTMAEGLNDLFERLE
jgi:pyruvate/2-oxoglutarate dehydrogenase complex dihydrolipoamide dehydrogenase (E3) component